MTEQTMTRTEQVAAKEYREAYMQAGTNYRARIAEARDSGDLTERQEEALETIIQYKDRLARHLLDAKRRAESALEALAAGRQVDGSFGLGFGPIGHQLPFDIASASQSLTEAINRAVVLQVNKELIEAAYNLPSHAQAF